MHPEYGGFISTHWSATARGIFLGLILAVYPFGQFIGSPILGSLSDQFGRKKLLLVSMFGAALFSSISGFAIAHDFIWLLILSRLFNGFLEGNIAIAQAYIGGFFYWLFIRSFIGRGIK